MRCNRRIDETRAAACGTGWADVRDGSKPALPSGLEGGFAQTSGHSLCMPALPSWATSGLMQCSKMQGDPQEQSPHQTVRR
jgi:hypothetical protein